MFLSFLSFQLTLTLSKLFPCLWLTFLLSKLFLRSPALSSSIRPRSDSSINMQPRSPLEMQSFQKLVYPCNRNHNINNEDWHFLLQIEFDHMPL